MDTEVVVFLAEVQEVRPGVSQQGAEAQEDLMNPSSLKGTMILKVPMLSSTKTRLNES